jgi:hypothetical protein
MVVTPLAASRSLNAIDGLGSLPASAKPQAAKPGAPS